VLEYVEGADVFEVGEVVQVAGFFVQAAQVVVHKGQVGRVLVVRGFC